MVDEKCSTCSCSGDDYFENHKHFCPLFNGLICPVCCAYDLDSFFAPTTYGKTVEQIVSTCNTCPHSPHERTADEYTDLSPSEYKAQYE